MATIYDVSKLAGVSVATVSRVVNNSGRVRAHTRRKVLSAMRALDYRPNSVARSLASNRTDSVGILVPELHGLFFGALLAGVEAELRRAGKHLIITVGHGKLESELDGIEFLIDRNCDALLIHSDAVPDDHLARLRHGSMPILVINRLVSAIADRCISIDNEIGGYLATRHVLDLKHTEVAYISGPLSKRDAHERLAGHIRALTEAGLAVNDRMIREGGYQESDGSDCLNDLLGLGLAFSVVVCANDSMAAGVMNRAREVGLRLPEDLSVVGFDDVSIARYLHPALTTVNYPIEEMGKAAARWALRHVYSQDGPAIEHLFRPRLVIRQSVLDRRRRA